MQEEFIEIRSCDKKIMAVHDAMYVVGGKWKISIIASLSFGNKRYSEVLRDIRGISGKMLSRELQEMELNNLIQRTVISTRPIAVQYELTEYGRTLMPVIDNLAQWGVMHRNEITRPAFADLEPSSSPTSR